MKRQEAIEAGQVLLEAERVLGGLALAPGYERLAERAHETIQAILAALDKETT